MDQDDLLVEEEECELEIVNCLLWPLKVVFVALVFFVALGLYISIPDSVWRRVLQIDWEDRDDEVDWRIIFQGWEGWLVFDLAMDYL
jgi:hypothetical protein